MKVSWTIRLMLLFITILSASLLFQVFYIIPYLQNREVSSREAQQDWFTHDISRELNKSLSDLVETLKVISEHETICNMDIDNQTEVLLQYSDYLDINALYVLNATGWFVSGTGFTPSIYQTKSYSYKQYFIQSFEQGEIYFNPAKVYFNNTLVTSAVSIPIESDTGERVGVLLGTVWLNDLIHTVATYTLNEGEIVYLVDTSGKVIAHSEIDLFALVEGPLSLNYSAQPLVQSIMTGETKHAFEHDHDGVTYIGTNTIIESNNWGVVVETPKDIILVESVTLSQNLWTFNIVLFSGALAVSLFFTR